MDFSGTDKITAFDTLFSTNHIQMLKILLSYSDTQSQKFLAVYIKFLELNYTIEFCKRNQHMQSECFPLCGCTTRDFSPDIQKLCAELLPFCTETEKKQLEQIKNLFQGMSMATEMSKTLEMIKEFMPDMSDFSPDGNSFNMEDMLMNMLSPEQKEMFTMFGGMNHDD